MSDDRFTVFVSSTSQDLEPYRAAARDVILGLDWFPRMMEYFGTSSQPTVEACRTAVQESDLVLLFVAFRRGWVPTGEQGGNGADSITALEIQHARSKGIPVVAFLGNEASWPISSGENEQAARDWVRDFRDKLNLPAVFFDRESSTPTDSKALPNFSAKVREALVAHKERMLNARAARREPTSHIDYSVPARQGLLEGTDLPFVGVGIYGTGPLSSDALANQLAPEANAQEHSLATVAEFAERLRGSRDAFLAHFRHILEEQTAAAPPPAVYDLIANASALRVVVCATFDRLLEQRLESAGKPFVVLMHVLRSYEGRHDGRILVLRRNAPPELALADKINIAHSECLIYRPLGSPFLPPDLDAEAEIDTVVLTESDHLLFLRRLENQHTQIPTRLARLFKKAPLLFLGYGLDVWQHRLVMQVFQSVGMRGPQPVTRAVRIPESPMEAVAWDSLRAALIPMDPNEFAKHAQRPAESGGAGDAAV